MGLTGLWPAQRSTCLPPHRKGLQVVNCPCQTLERWPRVLHCDLSFPPRWGQEGLYLGRLSSGCYNKLPLSRWLINNRHLFPTVLEAGSPRSGCSVVRFWVRALFLVCRWLAACLLAVSSHGKRKGASRPQECWVQGAQRCLTSACLPVVRAPPRGNGAFSFFPLPPLPSPPPWGPSLQEGGLERAFEK